MADPSVCVLMLYLEPHCLAAPGYSFPSQTQVYRHHTTNYNLPRFLFLSLTSLKRSVRSLLSSTSHLLPILFLICSFCPALTGRWMQYSKQPCQSRLFGFNKSKPKSVCAKFVSRISPWRYTSSRERVQVPLASWQKQLNPPACMIQQDTHNMFQPGLCTWKRGSSRVPRLCSQVPLLMLLLIERSYFLASLCWAVAVNGAAWFTSALPHLQVERKGIQLVSFLWMQTAQSAATSPEIHLCKWGHKNNV